MTGLTHTIHRSALFGLLLISFGAGLSFGAMPADTSLTFLGTLIVLIGMAFAAIGAVDDGC